MKAISPKNQTIVNRCIKAMARYSELNDLRDKAYDSEAKQSEINKYERLCAEAYDRYLNYLYELPKGQQKAIEKNF